MKRKALYHILGAAILLTLTRPGSVFSVDSLPSANGLCRVQYDSKSGAVVDFRAHLSDLFEAGRSTENELERSSFILRVSGRTIDLARIPVRRTGYVSGTGIILIEYRTASIEIEAYIWVPMTMEHKVLIQLLHVRGADPRILSSGDIDPLVKPVSIPSPFEIYRIEQTSRESFWVGAAILYTPGLVQAVRRRLGDELMRARPQLLLEAEQRWWMHWHRMEKVDPEIRDQSYETLLQSAAWLKMAQSREPGGGYGQIVSHLGRSGDNMAVPRDMAYAIIGLSCLGHFPEARRALRFMLDAGGGRYGSFQRRGIEWGMGGEYCISLSHYTGAGYERAAFREEAPLLQFEGQGLFLWALESYVTASSDLEFAARYWDRLHSGVIDPLLDSLDERGLVRRDSGIWNVPFPGEHNSYTSASAFRGLTSAALLARTLGRVDLARKYTEAASLLRERILSELTLKRSKLLKRSLEADAFPGLLDGTAVEAINWELVKPFWNTARSIHRALDLYLSCGEGEGRGYSLSHAPEGQRRENLFVTLRAVEALYRLGEKHKSRQLLAGAIRRLGSSARMVPEQFDHTGGAPAGDCPVIGLGAAPFILAVTYP